MNVDEYAKTIKVSPRRVRALIANGSLRAEKSGPRWIITEPVRKSASRRPLSTESRIALGRALTTRTLTGLTGQLRARTASRIRLLRQTDEPAALLADWWGGEEPEVRDVITSWVARAVRGDDEFLKERLRTRRTEYLRSRERLASAVSSERTIQGLTRAELADRAGVDRELVNAIEHGRPVNAIGALRDVLRVIDIKPSALPSIEYRK